MLSNDWLQFLRDKTRDDSVRVAAVIVRELLDEIEKLRQSIYSLEEDWEGQRKEIADLEDRLQTFGVEPEKVEK